ncbi:MAG TPA: NADH-quinone oxidoreductase subunit L [Dehalococcoidia bacterium]|nr:NADH-quinone oxidoreductase subunit L [Dehalococcoidia bacterium]
MGMQEAWLLPAIPAVAFVFLLLFGAYLPRRGDWVAIAAIGASFVLFFFVLADLLDAVKDPEFVGGVKSWTWVEFDNFKIELGFFVDQITIVMLIVVSFVALMVQIYSVAYMKGDPRYGWYFTVMCLFTASMLTLVLADNLLLMYAAWEGVGFCSFLLIGFWWERRSAAEAAKKAFITTRIGDVGFLIGIILLWREANTFNIQEIIHFAENGGYSNTYLTIAVLFLFGGAIGKSGQFPLHVWLPDAMEGPTPVSALIHAATMVVAGVYMVARMLPVFEVADPIALDVVTILGLTTVMLSATMGLAATDIKRVIAYSTLNSLGLMFVALGSHSVTAAMLYLFVHGFFKAMLFLGSGAVIHATEKQDVNDLGGLARKMPVTSITFALGAAAMIGVIPLSGFWAKDEVLHAANNAQNVFCYLVLLASLVITGLYMTRLYVLTFLGEPKDRHVYDHAHEAEPLMSVPLVLLAIPTVIGGLVVFHGVGKALGFPGGFGEFVYLEEPEKFKFHVDIALESTVLAVGGAAIGYYAWANGAALATRVRQTFSPIAALLSHRYYIDDIYQWGINHIILGLGAVLAWFDRVIVNDTGVDGSAELGYLAGNELKYTETGKIPNYALAIAAGVLVIAVLFLVLEA